MNDLYEDRDKREIERFDLQLYTLLWEPEETGERLEFYTRDISSDGAYICTKDPLPLETSVELTFFLPIRETIRSTIRTNGRVVRAEKNGMAVRFEPQYEILPLPESEFHSAAQPGR